MTKPRVSNAFPEIPRPTCYRRNQYISFLLTIRRRDSAKSLSTLLGYLLYLQTRSFPETDLQICGVRSKEWPTGAPHLSLIQR